MMGKVGDDLIGGDTLVQRRLDTLARQLPYHEVGQALLERDEEVENRDA